MKGFKQNFLSIAAVIIVLLLSINAYFAQDLVAGLKEKDSTLESKISAVDDKYSSRVQILTKSISENEKNIGLSKKDIDYIIKALDEIKIEVKKK